MAGSLTKKCTKCSGVKALAEFNKHVHTKDRRRPECRDCQSSYHRQKRMSPTDLDASRRYSLKKNFGITIDHYTEMFEAQRGLCAICAKPQNHRFTKFLAVDHCHDSGKVRGLLCSKCNSALGLFGDDPSILAAAIQYLLPHKRLK